MPQVSITIDEELLLKLDKAADTRGISRSRVVSVAVESYLLHGPDILEKMEVIKSHLVLSEKQIATQVELIEELKKDKTFLQGMVQNYQNLLPAPGRSWWSRLTGR